MTSRVLGLSGSLRDGSYNDALLRETAAALPSQITYEEWSGLAMIPPYNEDAEGEGASSIVIELREALNWADAFLIATPEYNHSIPGGLKSLLDWGSRPFPNNAMRGKPAIGISATPGASGGEWALSELRNILLAIGARWLDEALLVRRIGRAIDHRGDLNNVELKRLASELGATLLRELVRDRGSAGTAAAARARP